VHHHPWQREADGVAKELPSISSTLLLVESNHEVARTSALFLFVIMNNRTIFIDIVRMQEFLFSFF